MQRQLGHSSVKMTLDVYSKWLPGSRKAEVDELDNLGHQNAPTFASGATTSSPVFRCIDAFRGTLVLDEADLKDSQSHADLIKILNCGYMRGFLVIRSEVKGKSYEPQAFDVYGPKLIATRKKFQDRALESRCFTEKMDFTMRPGPQTDETA